MIYYYIFILWNVIVMLIYGIDKMRARKNKRRISEKSLLVYAFLFGGLGAIFGMVIFNHKTSKSRFRFLVPLAVILNIAVLYIIQRGDIL